MCNSRKNISNKINSFYYQSTEPVLSLENKLENLFTFEVIFWVAYPMFILHLILAVLILIKGSLSPFDSRKAIIILTGIKVKYGDPMLPISEWSGDAAAAKSLQSCLTLCNP